MAHHFGADLHEFSPRLVSDHCLTAAAATGPQAYAAVQGAIASWIGQVVLFGYWPIISSKPLGLPGFTPTRAARSAPSTLSASNAIAPSSSQLRIDAGRARSLVAS